MRLALLLLVPLAGCGVITPEGLNAAVNDTAAINLLQASRPGGYAQPMQQQRVGGQLKGSYMSGFNRICVYSTIRGDTTMTIGAMEICPLGI